MHLLFDLDGTLTDSSPGIVRCFAHALERIGHPTTELPFELCIGPPLAAAFETFLGIHDPPLIERAIRAYRERFSTLGMFENSLYPEVPDTLNSLRQSGHRMRVVTAKPKPYAITILQHFAIDHFFDAVHGPSLADRTHNKAELVSEALSAIGSGNAVMIGDRAEDIRAAKANGIASIAAKWGYGSAVELDEAGADYYVDEIPDVLGVISMSPLAQT